MHVALQVPAVCRRPVVASDPVNLLAELNPGMETASGTGWSINLASWTERYIAPDEGDCPITQDGTTHRGGAYSARLACQMVDGDPVGASALTSPTVAVTPGATYEVSIWVYGDGAAAGTYAVRDVSHGSYIRDASTGETGASWAEVTYQFTAPAGCTGVSIYLRSPSVDGHCYYDDVSLVEL